MRRYLLLQVEQASRRWKAEFEKLENSHLRRHDRGIYEPSLGSGTREAENTRERRRLSKAIAGNVLQAIGGLPERTALEPQIVGTTVRPGYRVEKVIFQSLPKYYVTALLYLPDARQFTPPYPGVLVACGHAQAG